MKRLLGRLVRVSPAMVVAMLALFVALTGTAVATTSALITGKNIKNGSITGLDIKNKSVTSKDIKGQLRGVRGLPGSPGPAGAKGDKGDRGDKGDLGPSVTHQNTRPNNLAIATCGTLTELTTLTLGGPATYLMNASGFIFASGAVPVQSNTAVNMYRDGVQLVHGEVGQSFNTTSQIPGAYAINRLVEIAGASGTIAVRACRQAGNATPIAFGNTLTATQVQAGVGAQALASASSTGS